MGSVGGDHPIAAADHPGRSEVSELAVLSRDLQAGLELEPLLQAIVEHGSRLLATPRVSVRLLDPTHSRLLAICRAGGALHLNTAIEYRMGEGLVGWIAQNAQSLCLGHPEQDPRFAPRPDMVEPMGSYLGVPLLSNRQCIGVLSAVNRAHEFFTPHHQAVLEVIAGLCSPHVEVARLSRLTQIDALTGAFNRRGLDAALPSQAPRSALITSLSVAMADIDHFKQVNDTHGHAAGDEVLKRVAQVLTQTLRTGDSVIRYGGEEFLLLLPNADLQAAMRVAERARAAVASARIESGGQQLAVTLSLGVAEQGAEESREETIRRADVALYEAKRAGRNCVRRT